MVYHLVTDDAGSDVRAVLVRIVAKIGDRGMRTGHQDLGDSVERIAYFSEELVLSPDGAAMLGSMVRMRADFLRLDMLGVELQDLSGLMVQE